VRGGLRRAHQGQEESFHRRAGPDRPQESHPPRRGRLGSEAVRRRRLPHPDTGQVLARGNGEAASEAAARGPVRRRHGIPAAGSGIAAGVRVRDRARHQGRGPGAARLARRAGGQLRPGRAGPAHRAGDPAGIHRSGQGRDRHRCARAQALHHPQERWTRDPGAQARARQGILRAHDVGAHGLLQGHAASLPGRRVLPRSQGRARRVGARARAPALLDQHLPELGPGAPVPHDLPQRRDQHGARKRQLDPRAAGRDLLADTPARPGQGLAADLRRPVGFRVVRQRPRAAGDERLLASPRGDDDDPGSVGEPHADGPEPANRGTAPPRSRSPTA
jgi:hypothetical protein